VPNRRRYKVLALSLVTLWACMATGCFESADELTDEGARMVNLRRDYASGKALFEQALAKDGKNARAHKNLATCLLKEGKVDEAIQHLQKAVELKPDYGEAHINLSILYYNQRNAEGTVEHLDKAVEAGCPGDIAYRQAVDKFR